MRPTIEQTCTIPLGKNGQHNAIVSACDYPALTKWRWNFKESSWKYGRKVYARRGGGRQVDGELRPTVLMHRFILETLMGVPAPDVACVGAVILLLALASGVH